MAITPRTGINQDDLQPYRRQGRVARCQDDSSALAALNGLRYRCNRPPESAWVRLRANQGLSVGCIAFREFRGCVEKDCCEIKRLFVLPAYRGSAIGVQLAIAALELAGRRGYQFAYLDTEPLAMAAAHRTYLKVGFVEYDRHGVGPLSVSFLRKSLVPPTARRT